MLMLLRSVLFHSRFSTFVNHQQQQKRRLIRPLQSAPTNGTDPWYAPVPVGRITTNYGLQHM